MNLVDQMRPIEVWLAEQEQLTGRVPRGKILEKITAMGLVPESVHNSYHKTVFVFSDLAIKFCNALEISRERVLMERGQGLYVDVLYIGTNMIVQKRGEPITEWTPEALETRQQGTAKGLTDLHIDNIMKFGDGYRIIDAKASSKGIWK